MINCNYLINQSITRLISVLTLLTLIHTVSFCQSKRLTVEELCDHSALIVEGEVLEKHCFYSESGNIFTEHIVRVESSISPESCLNEKISIVMFGGQIGMEIHGATHAPLLTVGDKGFFFLRQTKNHNILPLENSFGFVGRISEIKIGDEETIFKGHGQTYSSKEEIRLKIRQMKGELILITKAPSKTKPQKNREEPQKIEKLAGLTFSSDEEENCIEFDFQLETPITPLTTEITLSVFVRTSLEPVRIGAATFVRTLS